LAIFHKAARVKPGGFFPGIHIQTRSRAVADVAVQRASGVKMCFIGPRTDESPCVFCVLMTALAVNLFANHANHLILV